MNTIQSAYELYLSEVVPKNANEIQKHETKKAFYCGFAAMFGIVIKLLDENVSESAAEAIIETLFQELQMYSNEGINHQETLNNDHCRN